jgi:hypothetical protein
MTRKIARMKQTDANPAGTRGKLFEFVQIMDFSIRQRGATMYKEKDILHESGEYWVLRESSKNRLHVLKTGLTHSVTLCQFADNSDGLSCAVAYCDYLAKREESKHASQK